MSENDKIDDRIRNIFVDSLDTAFQFAVESRNIDALGSIANLCGEYIEWERRAARPVGFHSQKLSVEDEDE